MDAMQPQPRQQMPQPHYSVSVPSAVPAYHAGSAAYPSLVDFMGLELTEEMIRLNMPEYAPQSHHGNAVATPQPYSSKWVLFNPTRTQQIVGNCSCSFILFDQQLNTYLLFI